MKRIYLFAAIFLILTTTLVMVMPGLGYSANYPPGVTQLIANANKVIKTINLAEFKTMYDKKDVGLLIDVRDPNEFAAGHIPAAVNVSRGTLEFKLWRLVGGPDHPDYHKKIILYCSIGGRSALAAQTLINLGFSNVIAVNMHIADWQKAGYPFAVAQ